MSLLTDIEFVIPTIVALLTAILLFSVARDRRKLRHALDRADSHLAGAKAQIKEQSRVMARMRSEKGTVASLALSLPHVVQALNRGDLDPRRVPSLILNLVDAIFQPGQVLYYAARSAGNGEGHRELHLISHFGFGDVPEALKRIRFGEGKIGWVAEHRIDMLREDWLNPGRTEGDRIDDNHPALKGEIIGPLVHSGLGAQVLGVLCIGSLGVRPRDEKLMFQLVTNLGSMALVNASHVTRLRERANTDGLTGLLNKRYFTDELLAKMIVSAEREGQRVGLFIFDIDHFKNYNDTHGHPAGDELLRTLAVVLKGRLRPGDACARYGGEEFVVAMPDTTEEEAAQVAERIRTAIENHRFPKQEQQPDGNVTISGGVAVFPRHGTSVNELMSHADMALYGAKRGGRNRVMLYRGVNIGDVEGDARFDLVPSVEEAAED